MKTINSIKMEKKMTNKMKGKVIVALAAAFLLSFSSAAQAAFRDKDTGTRGGQFLKLPVGAKAIGMGEAATAIADDANAIYYNVAGLAFLDKKSGEYMFSKYVEETSYHWVGFGMPISETVGSFGIGFQYFSAGDIDETNISAAKVGTFKPTDLAVNLAYARHLFGAENSVGVNMKIINSKIKESATAVAFDLGVQTRMFMDGKLLLGGAVQNLGGTLKYETEKTKLPIILKLGAGYKVMENWMTALDIVFPEDSSANFALGTDYKHMISDDLALSGRLGYNSRNNKVDGFNGVSIGFGATFQIASLDYAWMPLGDLGSTHRVSLGVKF
ncbi:MAG: hypothetical protein A2901_04575 [Elusimicrobia bacterium RIFCSPLOWO2_01_FULL_54_10]|nr:MAG: hypothetical protein A2901_04575 [Elusimicrobia bacterium RIFCSPLOWO2_01_FULL_54_10]